MERFCFDYEPTDGDAIVQVWDRGICLANDFLGECTFQLETFLRSEKRRQFKLQHEKLQNPGSIELSVFLCPLGFSVEKKEVSTLCFLLVYITSFFAVGLSSLDGHNYH
jgi:hypothetical protein